MEIHTICSFTDNGIALRVVDMIETGRFPTPIRCIMDARGGCYSAISLSDTRRQPFLVLLQDLLDEWCVSQKPTSAIVFGAAGCALPRFLLKSFEDVCVTAVECSVTLIEIAQKYFLHNLDMSRLRIVNDDASKYFQNENALSECDLILSDVYNGPNVSKRVYSEQYIHAARSALVGSRMGAFFANLSGILQNDLEDIIHKTLVEFGAVSTCSQKGRVVLIASTERDMILNLALRESGESDREWKHYSVESDGE